MTRSDSAAAPRPGAASSASLGHVGVVGAGLAGSLMACLLADRGAQVDLLERRPDPRATGAEQGRSINLALSHRGIRALAEVGLDAEVLAMAVPMRGRRMHAIDGSTSFQPYGTSDDQVIHSVSRGGLNATLLDAAEQRGVRIAFDTRVQRVDVDRPSILVDGGSERSFDWLIGADGAYSRVRAALQRRSGFDYSQSYLRHGYKELAMPPTPGGDFALDPGALHIWPRGGYMMIALPNADRSFTCTLFWPLSGPNSFEEVETDEEVRTFFGRVFPDVPAHIPDLVEQYHANPVGSLVTIRCAPWHLGDRVVLIGDAAHAVVPFYGQGMNASFEDCRLLAEALGEHGDRAAALASFASDRVDDADALADLAIDNYVTMRDRVASRGFLIRRALGRGLSRVLPGAFLPLYTMVTFTSIPYAQAVAQWERQARTLRRAGWALAAIFVMLVLWLIIRPETP